MMQKFISISLFCLLVTSTTVQSFTDMEQGYELEMMDLLGLTDRPRPFKRHISLRNSASKFLLEIYNELNEDVQVSKTKALKSRNKRSIHDDDFITKLDRLEIEKCNNIVTFLSKKSTYDQPILGQSGAAISAHTSLNFNTNNIPNDLQLVYSALRIYQNPALGKYNDQPMRRTTISLYHRHYNRQQQTSEFRFFGEINSTTTFKGWLGFNTTRLLSKWLKHKTMQQAILGNDILVSVALASSSTTTSTEIDASDIGVVKAQSSDSIELQPFMVGYFNGPELLAKIQKLRLKRQAAASHHHKRLPVMRRPPPPRHLENYQQPKNCERSNFTMNFRSLGKLTEHIIAPNKFEAYFCSGECNFPGVGSSMTATNHAIVQTLVHMKVNASIPKPCCVPTVYGDILLLQVINERGYDFVKYKQSVAKECGCH